MSTLLPKLKKASEFLENYPKLPNSIDLSTVSSQLNSVLDKFLNKAEDLMLEQIPEYSEVAALIEGEGKPIADLKFLNEFSRRFLKEGIMVTKNSKANRTKLLKAASKEGKLTILKEKLDPNIVYRKLFDDIIKLHAESIREKLSALKPNELTGLVDANGLKAPRTKAGKVSKTKKSIDNILSQIKEIKLSDYY